jgi:hypothetical protein
MGKGSQRHAPCRFTPQNDPVPFHFRPEEVREIQTVSYSSCDIIYNNTTTGSFHVTKNSIIQLDLPVLTKW